MDFSVPKVTGLFERSLDPDRVAEKEARQKKALINFQKVQGDTDLPENSTREFTLD